MKRPEGEDGHVMLWSHMHGTVEDLVSARRCITKQMGPYVRRTFIDKDGRAVATGWFTM